MGQKKEQKKHPPRIITGQIKKFWIFICLQVLTSGYIVSHILKDISTSTNKHQVLDKNIINDEHIFFFFRKALYIHVASYLRKGVFPSQPCWKANLFKKCSDREPARLRLYGLMYIECSEQKNASQKPSVVVYNIGCQKGFI